MPLAIPFLSSPKHSPGLHGQGVSSRHLNRSLLSGSLVAGLLLAPLAWAQATDAAAATKVATAAKTSTTANQTTANSTTNTTSNSTSDIPASGTAATQDKPADTPPASANELFDYVINQAQQLAGSAYQKPEAKIPDALQNMDYSQYRSIRYRSEASIWKDESLFELQLFHLGFLYRTPVSIDLVENDIHKHLPFKPELFRYDGPAEPLASVTPVDMGYAGFRVHFPLNNKQYKDEVLVFQGASYFRLVGPGQVYGLSARGLAIDTAEATGEEFPIFRKFWLVRPDARNPTANGQLVIYALLDSPSVTGAYRFELQPNAPTKMLVKSRIFARKDIKKLGVAPLTSMFHHGENRSRFVDDFRPEVHDSDGLMMQTHQGEYIWRPLNNPTNLKVTSLQDTNPQGFGLMQRDRDFEHYLDAEADYERRPSLWVEPENQWGEGRVELVEIPTDSETNDNIVAYWVPKKAVKAGDQLSFDYQLTSLNNLNIKGFGKVKRTHIGWGALPGEKNPPPHSKRQFIVDFAGEHLSELNEGQALKAELQLSSGSYSDLNVSKLPDNHWRVAFKITPNGNQPVDMRLLLKLHNQTLSEVWSYVWHPDNLR